MTLSDSAQWFALHSLGHVWAGVDSAWEQYKLEAGKMLENGDESYLSSARDVGQFMVAKQDYYC